MISLSNDFKEGNQSLLLNNVFSTFLIKTDRKYMKLKFAIYNNIYLHRTLSPVVGVSASHQEGPSSVLSQSINGIVRLNHWKEM